MNTNNDLGELIKKLNELEARLANNESSLNEFLDDYDSTLSDINDLLKVKEKEYSESLNTLNKSSLESEYDRKSLTHQLDVNGENLKDVIERVRYLEQNSGNLDVILSHIEDLNEEFDNFKSEVNHDAQVRKEFINKLLWSAVSTVLTLLLTYLVNKLLI